jgi:hypothetical protein
MPDMGISISEHFVIWGEKKWWKVFQWWIVWSKFVMVTLWGNNTARHFQRYPLTELKRA